MNILVDMDGVVADWEYQFWLRWGSLMPHAPQIRAEERTEFLVDTQLGEEWKIDIRAILGSEGFYGSLPVIEGAIEGIRQLEEHHHVTICTAPLATPWCSREKFEWVLKYLGEDQATRMIITKDKTLVRGDILIDDKPEIKGVMEPEWTQVLYDQVYNREITHLRRTTWAQILEDEDLILYG